MIRARTTRTRPERRSSLRRTAALSLVALAIVTACEPASLPSDSVASEAPVSTRPTSSPVATTSATPTDVPSDPPASAPPSTAPTSSRGPGIADHCTGNIEQQDFFAAVAEAVSWDVYCPILPDGWFVQAGRYRLGDGGWLEVTYAGPADSTLDLREGAFCTDGSGCVPAGGDVGEASFAGRPGTLVELDGGGYAIVVDRGAPVSWLAVGRGIGADGFRALVAGLAVVPG